MGIPATESGGSSSLPGLGRFAWFLVVAMGVLVLVHFTRFGAWVQSAQGFRVFLEENRLRACLLYPGVVAGCIAAGTPRLPFYVLGGLAFGFWTGLLLAQIGALTGSWVVFRLVRWGGRDWVLRRLERRQFAQDLLLLPKSIAGVFLIRQLPLSTFINNLILSLSAVNTRTFLAGSFLGFLPQGGLAAAIGSGVAAETFSQSSTLLLVGGLAALVGLVALQRSRKRFRMVKTKCREH